MTSRGVQKCGIFFFRSSGVISLRCNGVNLLLMTSLNVFNKLIFEQRDLLKLQIANINDRSNIYEYQMSESGSKSDQLVLLAIPSCTEGWFSCCLNPLVFEHFTFVIKLCIDCLMHTQLKHTARALKIPRLKSGIVVSKMISKRIYLILWNFTCDSFKYSKATMDHKTLTST